MQIIPRDENFYGLFTNMAERLASSAKLLHELFQNPPNRAQIVAQIKEIEHDADGLTHEIIDRIDRTFVTPFDREDIHALASKLDDVVDLIDGIARRFDIFKITAVRQPGVVLAEVLVRATAQIQEAVTGMKQHKIVNAKSAELKRLEEEGDAIYHDAMGALFADTLPPVEIIKWKELYDKLEDTLDQCEDVANVLQSISIKNG